MEKLSEPPPDIILLDLMMPEMNGFEFMQHLRQREDARQVPVIVITARELSSDDRKELDGKVAKILQKGSFTTEDLLRELHRVTR